MAKAPDEAWELRCLLEMTDQILRKELADGVGDPIDNVIPFPVPSADGAGSAGLITLRSGGGKQTAAAPIG